MSYMRRKLALKTNWIKRKTIVHKLIWSILGMKLIELVIYLIKLYLVLMPYGGCVFFVISTIK